MEDTQLVPISDSGKRVIDLIKIDRQEASQLMQALSREEQISLVSRQATRDPKGAQDLVFLVDDTEGREILEGLSDRPLFRILKSQSSTHIGVLSLVKPDRLQSMLDLDQELFSAQGVTDPQTANHRLVSFLEEEDETFGRILKRESISKSSLRLSRTKSFGRPRQELNTPRRRLALRFLRISWSSWIAVNLSRMTYKLVTRKHWMS